MYSLFLLTIRRYILHYKQVFMHRTDQTQRMFPKNFVLLWKGSKEFLN